MLPTFVIGLREGLEAALIVGIIAAFLGQQGRKDALRQVWIGTAAAVAICIGVAIALQVISSDLPQRQQEGLETVVGALAICMVTYMVDGTRNLKAEQTDLLNKHVWVGAESDQPWLRGGSYVVARKIKMFIENWDR